MVQRRRPRLARRVGPGRVLAAAAYATPVHPRVEGLRPFEQRVRVTPHASRLLCRTSRLAPRASRLAPRASRFAPHASRFAPRALRLSCGVELGGVYAETVQLVYDHELYDVPGWLSAPALLNPVLSSEAQCQHLCAAHPRCDYFSYE